jgi:hypothetical protein
MTIKFGRTPETRVRHLVAALKVVRRFETHSAAKRWYAEQGEKVTSNCCVRGNPAVPIVETSYPHWDLAEWDSYYVSISKSIGVFLACKAVAVRLIEPPILTDKALVQIFKKIPCTQTPPEIEQRQFERLVALLRAPTPKS